MLDVIIEYNMNIVNYLDVTFNLDNGRHKQYINETKYIHTDSDYLPLIIK